MFHTHSHLISVTYGLEFGGDRFSTGYPLHGPLGMVGLPRHLRIVQAVIRHSTERAPRRGHLDLYSSIPSVEGHDPALIYHGALI